MHSVIELKYKVLYDKSREVLQFFKDYMSDDYINKYRHLTEKNIGIEEKSILLKKEISGSIEDFSLKKYINNGFLLNSGDRVICLPYSLKVGIISAYFLYVPDTNKIESTKTINIYFINSNIKNLKDDEVLYNKYILKTSCHILDTVISNMVSFPEVYNLPFNLFESETDKVISTNKIHNFIAVMMVLDKHYNLKFADWNIISEMGYEDSKIIEKLYCYAIEENKSDKDYEEILNLIYHL